MVKKILLAAAIIGIIIYSLNGSKPSISMYNARVNKFRREKNQAFRQSPDSPFSAAQKAQFDCLKYYLPDSAYAVSGLLSHAARLDTVLIELSDNETEKYLHWGEVSFFLPADSVEDKVKKPNRLVLFLKASGTDSTLFVPFIDRTNGHETYGGGRYLNVPLPKASATKIKLDFNQAYNPYCAYNNEYSCPVPPAENRLQLSILAGEKSFHD